ncbi:hypothetical protein [Thioflexithrix psekupsensis]|uniref:Uncharacterized protein n=1 Tax=Thioflexithrix psekupsensis TaxID=1570016 RepID=A0A251X8R7_9GAMM|nr:hypothetical protein [Thioflexithrix psekupsensis]OUD14325.1 hypothetical protein TPSD3_08365 [Thioflexithrix psekupsensis]
MIWAFLLLAASVAGASGVMAAVYHAKKIIPMLLMGAALCLVGAGEIDLRNSAVIHIAFVAIAFVQLGLVMYLTPYYVHIFRQGYGKAVCWGLGTAMGLFVSLSNHLLPVGTGQRLAAVCILLWLCWLAIFTAKSPASRPVS